MREYKYYEIQRGLIEIRYYINGEYQYFKICSPERLKEFTENYVEMKEVLRE